MYTIQLDKGSTVGCRYRLYRFHYGDVSKIKFPNHIDITNDEKKPGTVTLQYKGS